MITPAPHLTIMVDGEEPGPNQREWVMHHGSRLVIGDALLRMRLFMGLETARSAAFQQEDAYGEPPEMVAIQQEWQEDDGDLVTGYEAPAPVVMEEDITPGWEEYTQPRRQQILSWQDTGRYTYDQRYQPFAPAEEPEEDAQEWPAPYDGEQPSYGEWQKAGAEEAPPPRRGFFRRRRR